MKLRGMKYKVLHVPAFSSYFSSLNLYFYVSTLSVNRVGLGRLHLLTIQISLQFTKKSARQVWSGEFPFSMSWLGLFKSRTLLLVRKFVVICSGKMWRSVAATVAEALEEEVSLLLGE